jgi:hypothetical protein
MKYLSNAFSLNMIPLGMAEHVRITELRKPPDLSGYTSMVGHANTARVLGVTHNRESIKLLFGDELIVAQHRGQRLPEGATALPFGASFRWFRIWLR